MRNRVRAEREFQKITQEQLSQRVGVSRQTINAIEHGKNIPSLLLAMKISKALGKKVDDLFILEEFD
jgi:putative transcriptional regulator